MPAHAEQKRGNVSWGPRYCLLHGEMKDGRCAYCRAPSPIIVTFGGQEATVISVTETTLVVEVAPPPNVLDVPTRIEE